MTDYCMLFTAELSTVSSPGTLTLNRARVSGMETSKGLEPHCSLFENV